MKGNGEGVALTTVYPLVLHVRFGGAEESPKLSELYKGHRNSFFTLSS